MSSSIWVWKCASSIVNVLCDFKLEVTVLLIQRDPFLLYMQRCIGVCSDPARGRNTKRGDHACCYTCRLRAQGSLCCDAWCNHAQVALIQHPSPHFDIQQRNGEFWPWLHVLMCSFDVCAWMRHSCSMKLSLQLRACVYNCVKALFGCRFPFNYFDRSKIIPSSRKLTPCVKAVKKSQDENPNAIFVHHICKDWPIDIPMRIGLVSRVASMNAYPRGQLHN